MLCDFLVFSIDEVTPRLLMMDGCSQKRSLQFLIQTPVTGVSRENQQFELDEMPKFLLLSMCKTVTFRVAKGFAFL